MECKAPGGSKCVVCETYNMEGTWVCECEAINVGAAEACWKCKEPRQPTSSSRA
jgi:hypothetical protein